MTIEGCSQDDVFKYVDLRENDVILYLGGRIDDNNLYPPKYVKYLKAKIKRLNPTKIICHNPWYAKKYYEKGILTRNTKIDMIFVNHGYLDGGQLQTIDPTEYGDYNEWFKILIDKNPNIVYAMYLNNNPISSVNVRDDLFVENYDINNVKYFYYDRKYSINDLIGETLGHVDESRNASDGFAMVISLVAAGFKNINILGFSAFGSDEDMSYHSEYNCGGDSRFFGKKFFNLITSEDLPVESDIMKYWVKTKKINNIENYDKLIRKVMKPTIKDIFNKIQDAEVQTEPFNHLVVDNLLPDDFYKELAKGIETEDFHSFARAPYGNKERYGVDITDYPAFRASGGKIPTKINDSTYESLSSNVQFFVNLFLKNEKDFYSLLCSKLPTNRIQDDYFFHVNMTKDYVNYEIGPHTDDVQNIFTMLYYTPETDVNKELAALRVSTEDAMQPKQTIDFIPNRLVIFAPSKPDEGRPPTWHSVDRLSDKLVGTRNSFQMLMYKR